MQEFSTLNQLNAVCREPRILSKVSILREWRTLARHLPGSPQFRRSPSPQGALCSWDQGLWLSGGGA